MCTHTGKLAFVNVWEWSGEAGVLHRVLKKRITGVNHVLKLKK